jgi:hypothetical protein
MRMHPHREDEAGGAKVRRMHTHREDEARGAKAVHLGSGF